MKKFTGFLLCLLMLCSVGLFAACGGDEGERTELKVLGFRVEDKDFYEWFIEEFEKENPDIRISYDSVDTTNYSTLLQSRLNAGEVDVFGSQPTFFTSETYLDKMVDLTDLDIWDNIDPFVLQECTSGDARYIAPTSIVGGVVFYNKDLFAAAGITSEPTTWDEFIDACEKLEAHLGGITTTQAPIIGGLLDTWVVNIVVDTIEANIVRAENPDFYYDLATGETDMSDPLILEVLEKVEQISQYYQQGATGMQYSMAPGRFATGNFGMMIDGSWSLALVRAAEPDFEVGTFLLPTNDEASKNVNMCYKTGGGFSITKGTGKEDLARRFIEFHMRDDIMQKYADMCMMGPVKSNIEVNDPLAQVFYGNENYNYITLAENTFVRGMPGFVTAEVLNLFTGRGDAAGVAETLQELHAQYTPMWTPYVRDWLELHSPDRVNG